MKEHRFVMKCKIKIFAFRMNLLLINMNKQQTLCWFLSGNWRKWNIYLNLFEIEKNKYNIKKEEKLSQRLKIHQRIICIWFIFILFPFCFSFLIWYKFVQFLYCLYMHQSPSYSKNSLSLFYFVFLQYIVYKMSQIFHTDFNRYKEQHLSLDFFNL